MGEQKTYFRKENIPNLSSSAYSFGAWQGDRFSRWD
jgi:hypothetical protein